MRSTVKLPKPIKTPLGGKVTGTAEHDPEHPRPADLAIGGADRSSGSEVDLGFLAGERLHPADGEFGFMEQPGHVAADAVVLRNETMLCHQILVNPLGRKALLEPGQDGLAKRLTRTGRSRRAGGQSGPGAGGRVWLVLDVG